jgi:OOP family OmpA-OmpF porin
MMAFGFLDFIPESACQGTRQSKKPAAVTRAGWNLNAVRGDVSFWGESNSTTRFFTFNRKEQGMNTRRGMLFLSFVAVAFLLSACAMQQAGQPGPFQVKSLADGNWKPKADNLIFVLDTSSSMTEGYNGVQKFATAKGVLANFNQTMPDLDIQAAIRTFGHDPALSKQSTMLAYGLTGYSRPDFAASLDKIVPAGGPSPMAKALGDVAGDLKDTQGKIAMIVVSDGKDMGKTSLAAADALNAQYGDRLCLYTVLVGDNPAGQRLLADLSKITGCGFATSADNLGTGAQMANFVETVMLEAVVAPPAPAPVVITPPKKPSWVFNDIKFDFDKATLRPESYPVLDGIYEALRDNPGLNVEIQGHTCAIGTDAYNLGLSQRRAITVFEYLKDKGIDASRMTTQGFGESQPIDTNETREGRANNRRVEFKPIQ